MNIPPVILNAGKKHTATLVFLHGLGDTGMGWAGALNTIKPDYLKVKIKDRFFTFDKKGGGGCNHFLNQN